MITRKNGFTLIELLVVIAIIGLLASVVLVSMKGTKEKASIVKILEFSQSVQTGLGAEAVGIWSLDDGQGTTAKDSSGYGNSGVLYSGVNPCSNPPTAGCPTWTDDTPHKAAGVGNGKYALSFDGLDDYVRSTSESFSPRGGDLTLEAWIKTINPPGTATFLSIYTNGTGIVHCRVSSHVVISRFYDDTAGPEAIVSNTVVDDGLWHHIVVTYQRSSVMTGYVDGKKGLSVDISMAYRDMTTKNFHIGAEAATLRFFTGLVDEVRVYKQVLTLGEIQKHYAEGLGKYKSIAKQ